MREYAFTVIHSYLIILSLSFTACSDFVQIDVDKSRVPKDVVFDNEVTATAAVTGIYYDMYNTSSSFASGTYSSIVGLSSLSGDETVYFPENDQFESFQEYSISPLNPNVLGLWRSCYYAIYGANNAIEGLDASSSLSESVKNPLKGEALFIRAFSYFYLVNLFGDVPLVTTTDFENNQSQKRQPMSDVYTSVIDDLKRAQSLLSEDYVVPNERIRPNRAAAVVLLARVYLYLNEWSKAEELASEVVSDTRYTLSPTPDQVFLKNSEEAIWQIRPSAYNANTNEAMLFILRESPFTDMSRPFAISTNLLDSFEDGDARANAWIGSFDDGSNVYYYPYKYKIDFGTLEEYSMVLRLAEVYLIRSEARAKLDNLSGAMADLDSIRRRAQIPLISETHPSISKDDLLLVIEHERRLELFTEWGHRWLDLKRTDRADDVLNTRPGYSEDDKLYPIPKVEFDRNPNLGLQNKGY